MTHGFTRITGLPLAVLLVGSGPAWAGAYKHKRTGAEGQGVPPVGGALNSDTSVDGQVEPNVKQPEEPSASPRMETEPGARDRAPHDANRPAPRSSDTLMRPDVQSPRSDGNLNTPDVQSPRRDGSQPQGDTPSEPPLRSYKQ